MFTVFHVRDFFKMNNSSTDSELITVPNALPRIPEDANKEHVRELLQKFALENNFFLVTYYSTDTVLHLRCKRGGSYSNWRGLQEEERKRLKKTIRADCPYKIRVSDKKGKGFQYIAVKGNECFHNHPIDEASSLATDKGRKSKLDASDLTKINESIELNFPSKLIQKSISNKSSFNKLTIHDINNMKYSIKKRMNLKSDEGASKLLDYIKGKGFQTSFHCDSATEVVDGIFFTNETMIERTRQFPEVIVMDATYMTNAFDLCIWCWESWRNGTENLSDRVCLGCI